MTISLTIHHLCTLLLAVFPFFHLFLSFILSSHCHTTARNHIHATFFIITAMPTTVSNTTDPSIDFQISQTFRFGGGRYFSFDFKFSGGSPRSDCASDSKTSFGIRPTATPPTSFGRSWLWFRSLLKIKSFQSCLQSSPLLSLPLEIKRAIYSILLVSEHRIDKAHEKLGKKPLVLATEDRPAFNIDSTILRTCRQVYEEALPILYGCNTFCFSDPEDIIRFRHEGLKNDRKLSGARVLAFLTYILLAFFDA